MTAGQIDDYTGVAALLDGPPKAQCLLADRGHDADRLEMPCKAKGIRSRIPG